MWDGSYGLLLAERVCMSLSSMSIKSYREHCEMSPLCSLLYQVFPPLDMGVIYHQTAFIAGDGIYSWPGAGSATAAWTAAPGTAFCLDLSLLILGSGCAFGTGQASPCVLILFPVFVPPVPFLSVDFTHVDVVCGVW